MSRRIVVLTGALFLATAVAGCGKVGQLEPAKPLFGHHAGAAPAPAQDPTRPIDTVDPRDHPGDLPQAPPPPGAATPR